MREDIKEFVRKMREAERKSPDPIKRERCALILADDQGNLSKGVLKEGDTKTFGYGMAIVKDREKFRDVSVSYKAENNIKRELKARKVERSDKEKISEKIGESGSKTYGIYIDKTRGTPKGWREEESSDAMVGILRKSLEIVLRDVPEDEVLIVVDDHSAFDKLGKNYIEDVSKSLSKSFKKDIQCESSGSKRDDFANHMETVEFVARALSENKENGEPYMSDKMNQKVIRLDKRYNTKM
jgi:hypothetical protein